MCAVVTCKVMGFHAMEEDLEFHIKVSYFEIYMDKSDGLIGKMEKKSNKIKRNKKVK
jgi:hypothetical protein